MHATALVALLAASALAAPATLDSFRSWASQYGKAYATAAEEQARFEVFQQTLVTIEKLNAEHAGLATFGINQFSDLTPAEFKALVSRPFTPRADRRPVAPTGVAAPDAVDWRTQNAVTPVKDQGQCGSCWAFSTTGSVEGALAIASHQLVSYSEQQLVSCSSAYGNEGCNGGLMDDAFAYIIKVGIATEASYPYTSGGGNTGKCSTFTATGHIKSYTDVAANNYKALLEAVAKQPVSVAIEADQSAFQSYTGGIIDRNCGTSLDHGVLVVGYNNTASTPYWIVKNSWGASWGESGYVRIKIDPNNSKGICGINMEPSYPNA